MFNITESRRSAVDILLKGAGYLDCAVRHVLPQLPPEHRVWAIKLCSFCMLFYKPSVSIFPRAWNVLKMTMRVSGGILCLKLKPNVDVELNKEDFGRYQWPNMDKVEMGSLEIPIKRSLYLTCFVDLCIFGWGVIYLLSMCFY